jgi:uncharacterized surface protein with fasciclin (FAS1) repeats
MAAVMVAVITAAQLVAMAVQVAAVDTHQHRAEQRHRVKVTMAAEVMLADHQVVAAVQALQVETLVQAQTMRVLVEMDHQHIHLGDWQQQRVKT